MDYRRRSAVDDDRSCISFYQAQVNESLDRIDNNLRSIDKNLRPRSESSESHPSQYTRCSSITNVNGSSNVDLDFSDVFTNNDELNNHSKNFCNSEKSVAAAHECKVCNDAEENTEVVSPTKEAYPISEAAASNKNKITKSKRYIPPSAERTLDAPYLVDDFYLNLLDWRSINVFSIALGNTVYLWNASKGSTSELVTVEDDLGPITSVN
ncbi:hypothetical protein M5K25_012819 [Dendrobium thyrsiflorum]|uniref:Uncharacterized protein n=1 Tax=Dendrobium thyrsiflorum TaxID=117978 RepID=A0ABD0UYG1_DENTH